MTQPSNALNACDAYALFWMYCLSYDPTDDALSDASVSWQGVPPEWQEGLVLLLSLKRSSSALTVFPEDSIATSTQGPLLMQKFETDQQAWRLWCRSRGNSTQLFSLSFLMNDQLIHEHNTGSLFHPLWMAVTSKCPSAIRIAAEEGCVWTSDSFHESVSRHLVDFHPDLLHELTDAFSKRGHTLWSGPGLVGLSHSFSVLSQAALNKLEASLLGDRLLELWSTAPRYVRRGALYTAINHGHVQWIERVGRQLMALDPDLCQNHPGEVSLHAELVHHGVSRTGVSTKRAAAMEVHLWTWLSKLPIDFDSVVSEPHKPPMPFLAVCHLQPSNDLKAIWATLPILNPASTTPLSSFDESLKLELESISLQSSVPSSPPKSRVKAL
jgi:hypothetical protein